MASVLSPMLASPTEGMQSAGRFVADDDWVAEQKLDGHRVMLVGPGSSTPTPITRNGAVYSKGLPTAVLSWRLTGVNTSRIVLDCELVGSTLWAFDILDAEGSLDNTPLEDRRVILEAFLQPENYGAKAFTNCPIKIVPQAKTADEKERLLLEAAVQDFEGVVFKRKSSAYHRGVRSHDWMKLKFVQTADVVVMAVRDDGKESAKLGIYQPDGSLLEVGRCSLIGKPPVKPGDVAEVRYLYVPDAAKPRLYQPTLIRVRTDKTFRECDGSDFKFTNKSVLEVLP